MKRFNLLLLLILLGGSVMFAGTFPTVPGYDDSLSQTLSTTAASEYPITFSLFNPEATTGGDSQVLLEQSSRHHALKFLRLIHHFVCVSRQAFNNAPGLFLAIASNRSAVL